MVIEVRLDAAEREALCWAIDRALALALRAARPPETTSDDSTINSTLFARFAVLALRQIQAALQGQVALGAQFRRDVPGGRRVPSGGVLASDDSTGTLLHALMTAAALRGPVAAGAEFENWCLVQSVLGRVERGAAL